MTESDTAGEVMARLTGNDSKVMVIPGINKWVRTSIYRAGCVECHQPILKGNTEIQVCVGGSGYGPKYNHYHYGCFINKIEHEFRPDWLVPYMSGSLPNRTPENNSPKPP